MSAAGRSGGRVGGRSAKRAPQPPRGSSRPGQSAESLTIRSSNRNFGTVLHGEPREPIGAGAHAHVTPHANQHVREIDEPAKVHGGNRIEHNGNTRSTASPNPLLP